MPRSSQLRDARGDEERAGLRPCVELHPLGRDAAGARRRRARCRSRRSGRSSVKSSMWSANSWMSLQSIRTLRRASRSWWSLVDPRSAGRPAGGPIFETAARAGGAPARVRRTAAEPARRRAGRTKHECACMTDGRSAKNITGQPNREEQARSGRSSPRRRPSRLAAHAARTASTGSSTTCDAQRDVRPRQARQLVGSGGARRSARVVQTIDARRRRQRLQHPATSLSRIAPKTSVTPSRAVTRR